MTRLRTTLAVVVALCTLAVPAVGARIIYASDVIFDGVIYRSLFVDTEDVITTAYTAISSFEQCFEAIDRASDEMMEVRISYGCDRSYSSQIADPAILLVTPADHPASCGPSAKCLSAAFAIQISGQWAGSVSISIEQPVGTTIDAIAFPFAPHGYGTITGRVLTSLDSDHVIRVHLLNAQGLEVAQRGRVVHVLEQPVPQYHLQAAETVQVGTQYWFHALATVNPQTPDCLYSTSAGRLVSKTSGTSAAAAPHFLINKGYTTLMPSSASLTGTSQCHTPLTASSYRELRPPSIGEPGDWPYV